MESPFPEEFLKSDYGMEVSYDQIRRKSSAYEILPFFPTVRFNGLWPFVLENGRSILWKAF